MEQPSLSNPIEESKKDANQKHGKKEAELESKIKKLTNELNDLKTKYKKLDLAPGENKIDSSFLEKRDAVSDQFGTYTGQWFG